MQPQDAGGVDSWWHALVGLGGGALGTLATLIWRAARIEPKIRTDLQADITAAERRLDEKVEDMVGHFREAFNGMRDTIAAVQKEALPKDDFHRFRSEDLAAAERRRLENRDDFARLERKIDQILSRQ